ncbi:MAG: transposase [Phycisphaerae bacterium]|nr:transposase [Phycisphaerales bacterium]
MPSHLRRQDELNQVHFTTFCCYRRLQFFRHAIVCDAFIETMKTVRAKLDIRWLGYVVMPEHIHLLLLPQAENTGDPVPISNVLHDLKGLSGRHCKAALRTVWKEKNSLGTPPLDAWARGTAAKPFWKPRGYDFNVTNEKKVIEKLEYLHNNPVRRGLVESPEQWKWSSYRFYEFDDRSLLAMDWDGGFPIV